MATNTDPGHWFWRGVQSAIFYYVSCAPCLDQKYKKQRRREAKKATQEAVTTEPGTIRQPTAFQTNEQWAEELMLGPGPPKAWKPDELLLKVKQKLKPIPDDVPAQEAPPKSARPSMDRSRPSMDRKISDAFGTVKESFRNSIHPDKWNWKRYDREDETLRGLGDKVTRVWDKVTTIHHEEPTGRRRAHTNESDRDYTRGRIQALSDIHPAVVSQLPATREEAAWMLLPPPSAAVMNGKRRPGEDTMMRKPLAVIGRPLPDEPEQEEEDWDDVETPEVEDRPSQERHLSEPIRSRPPADKRHMSEPIHLLRPPPAVTTDLFKPTRDILDTKSDILPLGGTVTPKSRPSSWQFYIIPTAPTQ